MTFTLVDVVLIAIIVVFAVVGFMLGLIQGIGALIGLAAGTWVAGQYFLPVGNYLTPLFLGHAVLAKIISFLLIFILINRLVGFVFWLIEKAFHIISIIPFLKSINKLGGVILGLIEGILFLGIIIFVIAKIAPDLALVKDHLNTSQVAHWVVLAATYINNLLPETVKQIKSIF